MVIGMIEKGNCTPYLLVWGRCHVHEDGIASALKNRLTYGRVYCTGTSGYYIFGLANVSLSKIECCAARNIVLPCNLKRSFVGISTGAGVILGLKPENRRCILFLRSDLFHLINPELLVVSVYPPRRPDITRGGDVTALACSATPKRQTRPHYL